MMDARHALKERAKAHWTARGTKSIEVPEWQATVFYRTPNLSTLKEVMSDSKGDAIEAQARVVVACCTDEDGQKIWSKPEYLDLMKSTDPGIVARLANAIMAEANLDFTPREVAEDEKN